MNQKLGSTARQEIRKAMTGLVGTAARAEAERQAANHSVHWKYIYGMTEDLRKGKRKQRSDAGKRTFDLVEGTDVWTAAQLVIHDKLDPDQALLTVRTRNPAAKLPTLEYFRQMLSASGLGKKQRSSSKRAFRQWEAEFPGEIFQIDVTALKIRWKDEKTRRILRIEGVDKNHPQMDPSKLRVWQIMLIDDHSRRRFLRYIATTHITSLEMVRFECEAFEKLGVPHTLYTDNGSEFKGYHIRAARILNNILAGEGGYRHLTHMPGNSQASGKVEVAHKWAEKMDRYVGLAETEGQSVTIDDLNRFADSVCEFYDNRVHRSTGQTPSVRWHAKRVVVRKLPREIIESALMSDEFEVLLDAAMTVAHRGTVYRIPGVTPFVDYIGQRVRVVVPTSIDLILMTLPDGSEWEIDKVIATADKAGEFKSVAQSTAQDLTKRLRDTRKEQIRGLKAQKKLTGEIAPVPHYNVPIEQPATNVTNFPQPERVMTHAEVAAVTPVFVTPSASGSEISNIRSEIAYTGREMTYWEAFGTYLDRFTDAADAKAYLLTLFPDQQGTVPSLEIESAIDHRFDEHTGLRAVG